MSSKLFLTASTIVLISTFFSFYHVSFLSSPSSSQLDNSEVIPIVGAVGPESLAFDPAGGGPYTGVSDGRIIKWQQNERRWVDFAVTSPARDGCEGPHDNDGMEHVCGRPLGIRFNKRTGDLYIADAYIGLLVVGPKGGLATKVATQAQGIPFKFTNALDIDDTSGVVYFTDSSSRYPRRNYMSVIVNGDRTGRLMKYDPKRKETTVLLNNLWFPNGVALSRNGEFILVAETTSCRILRLWIKTSKAGAVELFSQLPGFPDNIKINHKGEFWVAIHSRRGFFMHFMHSHPSIGKYLAKNIPFEITKLGSYVTKVTGYGLAARLGENGDILEMFEDKSGKIWKCASEVEEKNGYLWIGSVKMPFVVKHNISTNIV